MSDRIENSNHNCIGYFNGERLENSNHNCIGYIRNNRIENSNHSCIGYYEGINKYAIAAIQMFDILTFR